VTVLFKPTTFRQNEVLLSAVSPGGLSALSTEVLNDAKKASGWVMQSAPGNLKPDELRTLLADKSVRVDFRLSRFDEKIDGRSNSKDLETLLSLVYVYATAPKIDPGVDRQLRNSALALALQSDRDPAYKFDKALKKFYYMDNPRILFDTKESITALNNEKMLKLFKEKFDDMNHFTFMIVGDTQPEAVERLIALYLANLPTASSEEKINAIIREELVEIGEKFATPRRTEIVDDYDDIDIEDLIPNEPMVVTITHRGYIKRVPVKLYEKQHRGGKGKTAVTTYDDDFIESFFTSNTHDTLMFVTDRGQLYWLKVYRIPEGSRTAKGKAVVNLINLQKDEKIMAIIPTTDFSEEKGLVFFTQNGIVKRTNLSEYSNIRSNGVRAINLDENDSLVEAKIVKPDTKWLFVATKKGLCIRFKVEDAREIGRVARGVTAIKFKIADDYVCGATTLENEEDEILMLSEKGLGKRTTASEYREQNRAGKGVISMKLTPKTGDVVGVVFVEEDKDLMCLTSIGKMIRIDMQTIRKAGRNTSGVKVVSVEKKDIVVSMAKCQKEEKPAELTEGDPSTDSGNENGGTTNNDNTLGLE
jgi:hypothetical protein